MGTIHDFIYHLGQFFDQYGYLLVFLGSLGENTAALGLVLPGGYTRIVGRFLCTPGHTRSGLGHLLRLAGNGVRVSCRLSIRTLRPDTFC